MQLYPLLFTPRLFHKIWGGQHIKEWYKPLSDSMENVGESWLISAVEKYPTVVANGPLKDNELQDLLEVYMGDLVGDKVYEVFGNLFPLLIKFIDADDDLSIQVHPDDDYAYENESSLGKTEMWYVMPSEAHASVVLGWKQKMSIEQIGNAIEEGVLSDYLCAHPVQQGDFMLIQPGTVHAMRRGTIVAEIQENSDITYRLYDYNRVGNDGKKRPLHVQKALEVMNREAYTGNGVSHIEEDKMVQGIAHTPYFTTNVLQFSQPIARDYAPLDSFVVYICVDGEVQVQSTDAADTDTGAATNADTENQSVTLHCGEAVLLPAVLNDILLLPTTPHARILEVYMDPELLYPPLA